MWNESRGQHENALETWLEQLTVTWVEMKYSILRTEETFVKYSEIWI
jgi:hypothetical protein